MAFISSKFSVSSSGWFSIGLDCWKPDKTLLISWMSEAFSFSSFSCLMICWMSSDLVRVEDCRGQRFTFHYMYMKGYITGGIIMDQ